jgi:hypothetical protein
LGRHCRVLCPLAGLKSVIAAGERVVLVVVGCGAAVRLAMTCECGRE